MILLRHPICANACLPKRTRMSRRMDFTPLPCFRSSASISRFVGLGSDGIGARMRGPSFCGEVQRVALKHAVRNIRPAYVDVWIKSECGQKCSQRALNILGRRRTNHDLDNAIRLAHAHRLSNVGDDLISS